MPHGLACIQKMFLEVLPLDKKKTLDFALN